MPRRCLENAPRCRGRKQQGKTKALRLHRGEALNWTLNSWSTEERLSISLLLDIKHNTVDQPQSKATSEFWVSSKEILGGKKKPRARHSEHSHDKVSSCFKTSINLKNKHFLVYGKEGVAAITDSWYLQLKFLILNQCRDKAEPGENPRSSVQTHQRGCSLPLRLWQHLCPDKNTIFSYISKPNYAAKRLFYKKLWDKVKSICALSSAFKSLKGDERQARTCQWEQANDFKITSHTQKIPFIGTVWPERENKNQLKKIKKTISLLWWD